jgi:uncharacterized protein with ParB-like and HNH nuclease domain
MQEIFSNTTLTVNQLIEKIDTGQLGLPELQRPFIWKDSKVRDLFDSMRRGYPIGYLMLWECPTLDKKKTIGIEHHSYDSPKEVIIDGQQRLTSLYEWIYNISDLFTTSNSYKYIGDFIKKLSEYRISKGENLSDDEQGIIAEHINAVINLKGYTLPVFDIKSNAEEEDVSEIFVRVNSGGVSLKQNDFILTLLSLYWDDGRRQIEQFSNENMHLTSLWFFYASLISLYTGSFESTVESHLNIIKTLTTLDEYKDFILSRVNERLTNDYFDITLVGSEGLAVSGRGNNAWNAYVASLNILSSTMKY